MNKPILIIAANVAFLLLGMFTSQAKSQGDITIYWPISGNDTDRDTITSPYGIRTRMSDHLYYDFHRGIDIRTRGPKPIHASADVGVLTDYGDDVVFNSGKWLDACYVSPDPNFFFRYAHLSAYAFPTDTIIHYVVAKGEIIATSGNTYNVPHHLHLGCQIGLPPNGPPAWNTGITTYNGLWLYPQPAAQDDSPAVTVIDTIWISEDTIDLVDLRVTIPGDELDGKYLQIYLTDPATIDHWLIEFHLFRQVVEFVQITTMGYENHDSLRYDTEIRTDSLFEFFSDVPSLHTKILVYADEFNVDSYYSNGTPFVLHVRIDPVAPYPACPDYLDLRITDFGGNDAWWRSTSPMDVLRKFACRSENGGVDIEYSLVPGTQVERLVILRKSFARQYRAVLLEGLFGSNEIPYSGHLFDSAGALEQSCIYEAHGILKSGIDILLGRCVFKGLQVPTSFELSQNCPNPFNLCTTIAFEITGDGEPLPVTLAVYNILGQRVAVLHDGPLIAGRYIKYWDGTDESGRQVASGIYFYRLSANAFVETKKMILLK